MPGFNERLKAKLEAAKAIASGQGSGQEMAVLPAKTNSGPSLSLDNNRLDSLTKKAMEIAQSVLNDPAAMNAVNAVQGHLGSARVGSPPGLIALFKRLGSEARDKYNRAQANEIGSFTTLQTQRKQAVESAIRTAHEFEHLPEDLAMEMLLKEIAKRTAFTLAVGQEQLLKEAFSAGWTDPIVYQEFKKTAALKELELEARQAEFNQDVDKQKQLAEIELWKQQETNRLQLEQIEAAGRLKIRLDNEVRRHREASTRNHAQENVSSGSDGGADD